VHTALIQLLLDLLGEAFAIGLTVMEDRNLRVAPSISQPVACDASYLVIAPRHPEDVRAAFIGQFRITRRRGDHEDSRLRVHLRGWNGGARAGVAGNKHHAVTYELPSSGDGLIAATVIIDQNQTDRLAKDAACRVEIVDRHFGTTLHLLPEPGIVAGDLRGRADQNLRLCRCRAERRHNCGKP
jgi:hypothetical protein